MRYFAIALIVLICILFSDSSVADMRKGILELRVEGIICSAEDTKDSYMIGSASPSVFLGKTTSIGIAVTTYPSMGAGSNTAAEVLFTVLSKQPKDKRFTSLAGVRAGIIDKGSRSLYTLSAFFGGRMYLFDGHMALTLGLNATSVFCGAGRWTYVGPMLSVSAFI
jgi:hypothetical protein